MSDFDAFLLNADGTLNIDPEVGTDYATEEGK